MPFRIHGPFVVGRELKEWELERGRERAVSHSSDPVFSWMLNKSTVLIID